MSSRGKQKRTKNNMQQRQEAILIAYYKNNPVEFFERELGVKLTKWQKFLLKMVKKRGFKNA